MSNLKQDMELLREYDAETGEETVESEMSVADMGRIRQIAEGEAYEAMVKTAGWKLFESQVHSAIEANLETLVESTDELKIKHAQAVVKVYRSVLGEVYTTISEATRLREEPVISTDNSNQE